MVKKRAVYKKKYSKNHDRNCMKIDIFFYKYNSTYDNMFPNVIFDV